MTTNPTRTPGRVSSQPPSVMTAKESDQDQMVAAIVLAFSADPAARWAHPDPHQFLSSFPDFVRMFAGKAVEHGAAHYVDGFAGAALWLPPGVVLDEEALSAGILRDFSGRKQEEVLSIFEQMGSYHPTEPHWYLPLIGVQPGQQGKGYGSALLRHALEICDRQQQAAYLDSSNPQNIPLYERHGFKVLGQVQVGSSPTIYPMARSPR